MNRAVRASALRRACRAAGGAGALWLLAASAGAIPPAGAPPGGAATRAVVEYSALEGRFLDGIAHRDRAALEALIAEDFAAFTPAVPDPIDRPAFIDAELARGTAARIYALAVLERGDLDLVSYLVRREPGAGGRPAARTDYVVDVWRRADHRLLTRYRSQPRRAPPPPSVPSGRG
jgi:hypothetical protein